MSVSSVAAIAMNVRSRSPGSYSRRIHSIEPSAASASQLGHRVGRDEHDAAVAGEQALDLLEPDLAAADDEAAPPGQLEAGDVERGLEHPLDAGLVAQPAAELADALLALIRGGRHAISTVLRSVSMAGMGYFDDDAMLRRVHRESAVALSGPRALLMQAAHPVAFAGFFAHTGALDEPYERLARTAVVMDTIGFGSRADADRATRRVRAMHRRVRGVTAAPAGRFPAGTPYAADDPALLLWILACLADSALVVYQKYVAHAAAATSATPTGATTARSAACSGCATPTCRTRSRASTPTWHGMLARRRPARDAGGARARGADRAQAAGAADGAAAARAGQPDHRRPAARRRSGASTACAGIRRGRSRCTAGRSTSSASWCRCCPSACASCPARGRRSRFIPEGDVHGPRARGCWAASEGTPHEGGARMRNLKAVLQREPAAVGIARRLHPPGARAARRGPDRRGRDRGRRRRRQHARRVRGPHRRLARGGAVRAVARTGARRRDRLIRSDRRDRRGSRRRGDRPTAGRPPARRPG